MRDDFHPDIIIGSVVSTNPTKPKENDLMSQIENMVMQKPTILFQIQWVF